MDDLGNMTEEKQGRLNDILQNAIRWLAAQADHLEFQNKDREWWAEENAWNMVEEDDQFLWLWQEENS